MNKYDCDPEQFEAYEDPQICFLTQDNLRTKRIYERERWEALAGKIEAYRGKRPIGNLLHFASGQGDVDINYGSYINE